MNNRQDVTSRTILINQIFWFLAKRNIKDNKLDNKYISY